MQGVPIKDRKMKEISAVSVPQNMYFIDVPSPDNIISEKLMIASLEFGSSTAIDALVEILSSEKPVMIGVVGDSDAVNAATAKAALKELKNKKTAGTVYLVADTKAREELHDLAQTVGIKLIVVPLK